MDYTERLRAFPLLSGISDEDLFVLSGLLTEKRTRAGENIITVTVTNGTNTRTYTVVVTKS